MANSGARPQVVWMEFKVWFKCSNGTNGLGALFGCDYGEGISKGQYPNTKCPKCGEGILKLIRVVFE